MELGSIHTEDKIKFKKLLKSVCLDILKKRVQAAEFVMKQAQDSANHQEKSSAGDKYETGRAMGQNDRDMNARQVNEAKRELQLVEAVQVDKIYDSFIPGAVAVCDQQIYFMAAGLGSAEMDHRKIILLSPQAPLSSAMLHKKPGDKIIFNDKEFILTEVY